MNKLFFLVLLFALHNQTVTTSECDKFKQGTFKLDDGQDVYTIIRTQNRQIENSQRTGGTMEFKIRWMSDCSYILYDPKVIKGDDLPSGPDTLYCKITSIDGLSYRAKCKMKGYEEIETPPILKIK